MKSSLQLIELPEELENLFNLSNGINQAITGQVIAELIWSIDRIGETNIEYRNNHDFKELYMSFDQLMFISDAGNGDLFGYSTIGGKFYRLDIYCWNHENDSRTWVAPNLLTFVEW